MKTQELQYRLLYSLLVAGKSAKFAGGVMARFIEEKHASKWRDATLFGYIQALDERNLIEAKLRLARSGCYSRLTTAFYAAATSCLPLRTCPPEHLEAIHGIGPKTSRFFILWTRPGAQHAALDTHVLKWLGMRGHTDRRSTPPSKEYARLEGVFLREARRRRMTARDLDAAIWDWCSDGGLKWGDHLARGNWPRRLR